MLIALVRDPFLVLGTIEIPSETLRGRGRGGSAETTPDANHDLVFSVLIDADVGLRLRLLVRQVHREDALSTDTPFHVYAKRVDIVIYDVYERVAPRDLT